MDNLELILFLTHALIVGVHFGLVAAFLITLAKKWGLLMFYDIHRFKWMPERCEWCLGFWISVLCFIIYHHFALWPAVIVGTVISCISLSLTFRPE